MGDMAEMASGAAGGCGNVRRYPEIKKGSAGGDTAGDGFPRSRKEQAKDKNPNTRVYCRVLNDKPEVDHAVPRSRGGNASHDNAQITCRHCNASKGNRDYPVSPPPWLPGAMAATVVA